MPTRGPSAVDLLELGLHLGLAARVRHERDARRDPVGRCSCAEAVLAAPAPLCLSRRRPMAAKTLPESAHAAASIRTSATAG